jgi:hypothetical protein
MTFFKKTLNKSKTISAAKPPTGTPTRSAISRPITVPDQYKRCKAVCIDKARTKDTLANTVIDCVHSEMFCQGVYNKERIESYCDRIIYEKSDNIKVYNIEYNSQYNELIKTSDHAPVYFSANLVVNSQTLKILYITINQAGKIFKEENVISEYQMPYYASIHNYDIIVICQQETSKNDTLFANLQTQYASTYHCFNASEGSPVSNYYVRLSVLIKKKSNFNIYSPLPNTIKPVKVITKCLATPCNKSYVGLVFDLRMGSNRYNTTFFRLHIFGAHLPISFSKSDPGSKYAERLKALLDLLKTLRTMIDNPKTINNNPLEGHFSIVGGDLNFRIENEKRIEQLELIMTHGESDKTEIKKYFQKIMSDAAGKNYEKQLDYFKGWIEENINFLPSCKINETKLSMTK